MFGVCLNMGHTPPIVSIKDEQWMIKFELAVHDVYCRFKDMELRRELGHFINDSCGGLHDESTCFVTSLACRWCCQMQPVWRSGSGRLKTFVQIYEHDLPYGILTVIYHAIWSYPESRFFFDKVVGSCRASQFFPMACPVLRCATPPSNKLGKLEQKVMDRLNG